MLKKIISIFSVFIMLLVFLYHNDSFYSKLQDSGYAWLSDDIVNEFNVARMIHQKDVLIGT